MTASALLIPCQASAQRRLDPVNNGIQIAVGPHHEVASRVDLVEGLELDQLAQCDLGGVVICAPRVLLADAGTLGYDGGRRLALLAAPTRPGA